MQFIHSQMIIGTMKRPSRTSPGGPSLIGALCPTIPHGRQRTNRRNPRTLRSGFDGSPWTTASGPRRSGIGACAIGARSDGTRRCGRSILCGTQQGSDMAMSASAHRSGISSNRIERRIGNDQPLNVERRVGGNETQNVEA
jgi:hypothetical protein